MITLGRRPFLKASAIATVAPFVGALSSEASALGHGMSMYGDIKYPPDFPHYDYASPAAIKGGKITYASIGTYDSLNPFIVKGVAASGIGMIYDTLCSQSGDEPFTLYGELAEGIDLPEDRSEVTFRLRAEARWHDGMPVTPEDVIFTFNSLIEKGNPFYRAYYADVGSVEQTGERDVTFQFTGGPNRELPLIMGQLTILPKHYYADRDFAKTTLEPPLGSGPYRISEVDPGRMIEFERVKDWWGESLGVNVGRNNPDIVRYEYYRDQNVALEAFKAGEYDFRRENTSRLWATAYEGEKFDEGLIVKESLPGPNSGRMQSFVFNTRREMFKDPSVRRALGFAFDFEWSKTNLFYGLYQRITSYFDGLPDFMSSTALPDEAELALLEPYRDQLPEEVFTELYAPPVYDGSGNIRSGLRQALRLLREAGWGVQDGVLTETSTGTRMEFEILLVSPAFERIVNPFARNLEKLGVNVTVRTVDSSQYVNRLNAFDFDMIVFTWGQSNSPGNEQRNFWGTDDATRTGSRNFIGVQDPVIDDLINKVIQADSREALATACRALDRVLLWNHFVIPQWRDDFVHVAYWNKFSRPDVLPEENGLDVGYWWIDPEKQEILDQKQNGQG